MRMRIHTVGGHPVLKRTSLGDGSYLEAGQISKDLSEEFCQVFLDKGICTKVEDDNEDRLVEETAIGGDEESE